MGVLDWPFLGREAVRRGEITTHELRRDYRSIYRNVYVPRQIALTAAVRA
jgi:hypothetical protein